MYAAILDDTVLLVPQQGEGTIKLRTLSLLWTLLKDIVTIDELSEEWWLTLHCGSGQSRIICIYMTNMMLLDINLWWWILANTRILGMYIFKIHTWSPHLQEVWTFVVSTCISTPVKHSIDHPKDIQAWALNNNITCPLVDLALLCKSGKNYSRPSEVV